MFLANDQRARTIAFGRQAGLTLIEVIVVIAILATMITVAIAQLTQTKEMDVQTKLGRLAGDFRSAYDTAVLSGKAYRIGFRLQTGEYWLEEGPDDRVFKIGDATMERDLTPEEERNLAKTFEEEFDSKYAELAGEAFLDPETDKEIKPSSPLLQAKKRLAPPKWFPIDSLEWASRSLGPNLMIGAMQAEHHLMQQNYTDLGPEGIAYIYVFPSGYIERAFMHLYYTVDDGVPDQQQQPYTITTDPYTGMVDIETGAAEVDLRDE